MGLLVYLVSNQKGTSGPVYWDVGEGPVFQGERQSPLLVALVQEYQWTVIQWTVILRDLSTLEPLVIHDPKPSCL